MFSESNLGMNSQEARLALPERAILIWNGSDRKTRRHRAPSSRGPQGLRQIARGCRCWLPAATAPVRSSSTGMKGCRDVHEFFLGTLLVRHISGVREMFA